MCSMQPEPVSAFTRSHTSKIGAYRLGNFTINEDIAMTIWAHMAYLRLKALDSG